MNMKRSFCFLYLKELSTEINTIQLHDSNRLSVQINLTKEHERMFWFL